MADLLARKGVPVRLWDHDSAKLDLLSHERRPFGVPELELDESVRLAETIEEALDGTTVVVFVVPSQAVRGLAAQISASRFGEPRMAVLASKGLDVETLSPLSEVIANALPHWSVGVVSGPCIAREVARCVPTSVVAACADPAGAIRLRGLFASESLRVYTQPDVLGVELGGALKNIIAIAAGIGDGLGFGANTKSALMTRGLAEISRLAGTLGAHPVTLFGLAGLGDLAVTCFSPHSRNRTYGELLGKGTEPSQAREQIGMTVEGEPTARAALRIAGARGIDMPITQAVVAICDHKLSAKQAVTELMTRELKDEFPSSFFDTGP